jgi:hypothetical protein
MTARRDQSTTRLRRVAGLLVVSLSFVALNGCGNGLAQVSGQVTLDGNPLRAGKDVARVTVQFLPADGQGANGVGLADENGVYRIGTGSQFGVRPGDYLVTCFVSPLDRASPTADPKFGNAKTSGLRFTVQPGKNEFSIPLQSAAKNVRQTGA